MSYKTRVKINIFGIVQGVNFRSNVKKFAQNRGITGWAKNTEKGDVVINAEGKKQEIKDLIEYCKKGSEGAKVKRCEAYYQKYKDEFTRFDIL